MKAGVRHLPYVHQLQLAINQRMASPALGLIIVTGIYQTIDGDWGFGSFWISATFAIAIVLGIPAGVYAASKRGSFADQSIMGTALVGYSMPSFWKGILLIWLFAVTLRWFPTMGYVHPWEHPGEGLWRLALPALTLGTFFAGLVARITRSSLLEVLEQDYIKTATAKGVRRLPIVYKHALRNALIPVVTVVGLSLPTLVGGAVLTETVFAWPGVGRLAVGAVFERDYPVIMGVNLLVAAVVITANLVTDLAYCLIDPRISYS